jgi:23S rRNA pseudouridine1911/1915/1917 synthase
MNLKILYEDNHVIAVDKPAGMLTQGDSSGRLSIADHLKDHIKRTCNKPGNVYLGMVHRLDRPVSGVLLFARTSKAAKRLSDAFRSRSVDKYYIAVTHRYESVLRGRGGDWTTLTQNLERRRETTYISETATDSTKEASLQYMILDDNDRYLLMLIRLLTGRKHQIRSQLLSIGCPVVGDTGYGSRTDLGGDVICLHAFCACFNHPTRDERMRIAAEIPAYFNDFIRITPEMALVIKKASGSS